MHGAVRVRDDLHPFHITVFSQPRVDMFFGNEVGAVGRNLEALLHADDQVGLAVGPLAVGREGARRWRIGSPALGGAAVHPRGNHIDFAVAQGRVLEILTNTAIDMPWRHFAAGHLLLHGARPRARVAVVQQRHGRMRARPMAGLARALKNGQDVLVERRGRRGAGCLRQSDLFRRENETGGKRQANDAGKSSNGDH